MSVVTNTDAFNMHHTIRNGAWRGYRITFALTCFDTRKPLVQVFATHATRKTVTDPKIVATILAFDDWPEFAQNAFRQRVEKGNNTAQERLF